MIALTVVLLVLLSVLAPLKVRLFVTFCPTELVVEVRVWLYFFNFFNEKAQFTDGKILLSGSVGDCVRPAEIDVGGGKNLGKCLSVDELHLLVTCNLLSPLSTAVLPVLSSLLGCSAAFTHTVTSVTCLPGRGNAVSAVAKVRTNLAEVGLCLLSAK